MEITIFGASGFIGKELVKYLLEKNYSVNIITRNKNINRKKFNQSVNVFDYNFDSLLELINKTEVIINLAGENISGGMWTKKRKQKILDSRVKTGNLITSLCEKSEKKPTLLIQASAIGYYGFNPKSNCNEQSEKGEGFLADVCEKWENSTQLITNAGIKRSIIRTGIVLGNTGGIMPKLLLPFRFYSNVLLGKGKNYLSWIHIKDEIRAIEFIIQNPDKSDIYNLVAPNPVTMSDLLKNIAEFKNPLIRLTIPDKILNYVLGDMGKEMVLANQHTISQNLLNAGFRFEYEHLNSAITDILK